MVDLTAQDLLNIHEFVRQRFRILAGAEAGLLDSIAVRPNQGYFGREPFPDIWSKAASIMEAIIRWHPFADGNKRTALLAARVYLDVNGYRLILPLSAVRFSVEIAMVKGNDPATIQRLLVRTAHWIRNHSAQKGTVRERLTYVQHIVIPIRFVGFLMRIRSDRLAFSIISHWLAFDIQPDYRKDATEVVRFLGDVRRLSLVIQ